MASVGAGWTVLGGAAEKEGVRIGSVCSYCLATSGVGGGGRGSWLGVVRSFIG